MTNPWMKFYPRDWRGDQALRAVSVGARGLWIECLCIMHEAKPYGHLMLNGKPVENDALARMTGVPVDEVSALMAELRQAGVLSVTGKGVVFSRRMTKDHARAQKGRKAATKRWSQVPDGVEQSGAPNGSPNGSPTTQKPEARSQNNPDLPSGDSPPRRRRDDLGSHWRAEDRVPPDWRGWAAERGVLSEIEIHREAERFADHWAAASGQSARKRDWRRAWQKWIGKAEEYANERRKRQGHGQRTSVTGIIADFG